MKLSRINFSWLYAGVILACLSGSAAAAPASEKVFELDGQTYGIPLVRVDENGNEAADGSVFLLMGKESDRLIAQSGRRFSWSANGSTLIVFGSDRQLTVSAGDGDIKEPGRAPEKAAGRIMGRGGQHLIEPALFIQLLGLTENPCRKGQSLESDGQFSLSHKVYAPRLKHDADGGTLSLCLDSHPAFSKADSDDGTIKFRFANAVWSEPEDKMHLYHVNIKADSKNSSDSPVLELAYKFPPHWHPQLRSSFNTKTLNVVCSPSFGGRAGNDAENSVLESVTASAADGGEEIKFSAGTPFRYFWSYCPDCRRLIVDLDRMQKGTALKLPSDEPGLFRNFSVREAGSSSRPVLRLEMDVPEGVVFSFPESELDSAFSLKLQPSSKDDEDKESADMTVGRQEASSAAPSELAAANLRYAKKISGAGRFGTNPGDYSGEGCTMGFSARNGGIIVIDPGHGGGDPGCRNRGLGVYEKDVTLDVALRLRDLLEAEGWTVVLTRETDRDVSWLGSPDGVELRSRCDVANSIGADYFMSLHCNASVSSRPNGTSIHWCKNEDSEFAEAMGDALGSVGFYQFGPVYDRFYVLRNTDMPAVLVEMAFLTNYSDGSKLADPQYRQEIAEALAESFLKYASEKKSRKNVNHSL